MLFKVQYAWESLKNNISQETLGVICDTVLSSFLGDVAGPLGYCKYEYNCPHKRLKGSVSVGHSSTYLESGRVLLDKDQDGNYLIIGTGAHSIVYRGIYIIDKENMITIPVAVKVPREWNRPDQRECFYCELQVLNRLKGTKCAPRLYGPVHLGKLGPAIVMEYISGCNLWQFLQNPRESFTRADWLELAADLGDCLCKIHEAGYLHNDLKMDNIIIQSQPDGSLKPKIIDFGHATKSDMGLKFGLCASKMPPCYAPEVCNGGLTTVLSDVYTLGVALGTLMEAANLYTEIGQLVEQCVSADPSMRPSLRSMKAKLRQVLALQNAAGEIPLTPENINRLYQDNSKEIFS